MNSFEKIAMTICTISFVVFTISTIIDIIKTNKRFKEYEKVIGELEVYRGTLHRNNEILKGVRHFGEWLDTYHCLMRTNVKLEEDNEFNRGTLMAAQDIENEFLNSFKDFMEADDETR